MLHHLLYVASPDQISQIKIALDRLKAIALQDRSSVAESYLLEHKLLAPLSLNIHLISDLDAITPHLRTNPVDILVYDERRGGMEARTALAKIRDDVMAFADHWGPDFLFPMSRVVAILTTEGNEAHRAFELGRVQVRDVCVNPRNTAAVLRWLHGVLMHGVIRKDKVGMALSGGGLEGFLYQVGTLHALGKALKTSLFDAIDCYSGVSSGAIAASLMAGGVDTNEVIRAIHGKSEKLEPLTGSMLFDVAAKDIGKRVVTESFRWAGIDPAQWMRKFVRSVPTGIFKGEALKSYFRHVMETYGTPDTFLRDGPKLFIGATDQDTFEHVTFGKKPWENVPVSEALRASCALPPFFTPSKIEGRWFIDGQVTKTCNIELLVETGCRLIFIIDPMRPLATVIPGSVDKRGGIFATIQTIKALIYTRFRSALTHMTERYPDIDFIVLQPDEECAVLMAGSPMRYKIRKEIVDAAYTHTLRQLRERHHIYQAKLARYGITLLAPEDLKNLEKQGVTMEEVNLT